MQLLERYLNAVRFWLPADQQDDIIAELGDDLRAEIADRESDLGRPLDESEISAILKRRGDPVLVASNFLETKPLIGAVLMPIYWFVLRLVTLWILIPCFLLIVGPIEMARQGNPGIAWGTTLWNLLMAQVFALGVITLIFAVLERSDAFHRALGKSAEEWDPRKLPALPAAAARQTTATPRTTAIAEIVSSAVVGILMAAILWSPMRYEINNLLVSASPIWKNLRWLLIVPFPAGLAVGWFSLVRPYSIRAREWFRAGIEALNLILLAILLWASEWVTLESTTLKSAEVTDAAQWANFGIRIGLGIAALITGYSLVDKLLGANRTRSKPVPTHTPRQA